MRRIALIAFILLIEAMLATEPVEAQASPLASPAASASPAMPEALKPGTIIGANNAGQYERYIPAAGKFAIAHGFRMRITPERRVEWSAGFRHANAKYSPQITLDTVEYIKNYVARLPPSLIHLTDPH